MNRPAIAMLSLLLLLALPARAADAGGHMGRPLQPEDWYRFHDVSALAVSPDGSAVAYLVTSYERAADESRGAVWLVHWHGQASVQLTHGESASDPRFTPGGRYVSFLSARPRGAATQLWEVSRSGGKLRQLSRCSGEVTAYDWAGDGRSAVLVMHAAERPAAPQPIAIDAWHFKEDKEGYLSAAMRGHLYLLDIGSGTCTSLAHDEQRADSKPVFSPDGRRIAFVGHDAQQRRAAGTDQIYLVDARPGAQPRRLLSTWSPNHQRLEWSPDGRLLAFLEGDEPKYNAYITDILAVAELPSGHVRELTRTLDRAVLSPKFTADGKAIEFAVEDDGQQYPERLQLSAGSTGPSGAPRSVGAGAAGSTGSAGSLGGAARLSGSAVVVSEITSGAGHTAVLASDDRTPFEVFALEDGRLRRLSDHHHAQFAELSLGSVEDIHFPSRDGTEIHGQIVKPPDYRAGRRYPTIVWIHGGPNGQDDHSLPLESYSPQLERQLFATQGYIALAINYRGSTGRGARFARSIFADWGHLEVEDLLAGVDYAVGRGLADQGRLGIGGWSYGGLLTDYTIASDTRFRSAISGAGSGNQLSMYGVDEYVLQYEAEIGSPWRTEPLWIKLSYPFFHADRIRTPTLFLGGDKDFNVPLAGGEQMYQALRTLGVPAQLIVYRDEHHELTRPSFLVDRYRRYLGWMDRYLNPH